MTSSTETGLNTYSVAPADRGSITSQPNMLEVGVAPSKFGRKSSTGARGYQFMFVCVAHLN